MAGEDVLERLTVACEAAARSSAATQAAIAELEARIARHADAQLAAHEGTRRELATLSASVRTHDAQIATLTRHAFGSDPPGPSSPPPAEALRDVAHEALRIGSNASLEAAAVESRVLVKLDELRADMRSSQDAAIRELRAQSRQMGIGVRGFRWLLSPKGREQVVRLATLAGAIYAAAHAAMQRPPPAAGVALPPAAVSR